MFCTVLTTSRSSGIGNGLTYEADESVSLGSHVRVPLRRSMVDGIVISLQNKHKEEFDVKKVQSMIGESPYLSEAQIKTLRWMSEYYQCSLRQAMQAWLPSPSWDNLLPKIITLYSIARPDACVRGVKQKAIIEVLLGGKQMTKEQLRAETGASLSTINSLVEKGIVIMTSEKERYSFETISASNIKPAVLTEQQQEVYEQMSNDMRPSLLFGVTSSGKTEIYASMIADCIRSGKQSILLVPEILLTEHCIHRFQQLLGEEHVEVLHSKLSVSQKRAAWKRIHSGAISLVIGSRSALFAPLHNIGLIILDEEHEWTYKNEQTPRYHARDTAEALCRFSHAKLVLGSATPSLESWAKTKSNNYHLVRLPERYKNRAFPEVRVVDLATVKFGSLYPFSPPLLEAISNRLTCNEQSILFLNRRGVASSLLCLDCRRRIVSPDSQLPFTVHNTHEGKSYLVDHTTGLKANIPDACPHCQSSNLHAVGAGTQKLEDLLRKQFPGARILRADKDTLKSADDMRTLLSDMREQRADILLGTQSVVKGLDLPHVTLATVLVADVGLSLPHFRAGERIFQILTQLTGRSGRAKPGEVIIQTFRPDAPEVRFSANHQTEEYLEQELKLRIHANYPPVSSMIRLIARGHDAQKHATSIANAIQIAIAKHSLDCTVSSSPAFFGGGSVWHVFIRGSSAKDALAHIDTTHVTIDIDPLECV